MSAQKTVMVLGMFIILGLDNSAVGMVAVSMLFSRDQVSWRHAIVCPVTGEDEYANASRESVPFVHVAQRESPAGDMEVEKPRSDFQKSDMETEKPTADFEPSDMEAEDEHSTPPKADMETEEEGADTEPSDMETEEPQSDFEQVTPEQQPLSPAPTD